MRFVLTILLSRLDEKNVLQIDLVVEEEHGDPLGSPAGKAGAGILKLKVQFCLSTRTLQVTYRLLSTLSYDHAPKTEYRTF